MNTAASASPTTVDTFLAAKSQGGWRTNCRRSPLRHGSPLFAAVGEGWEPAHERAPRAGYVYALEHTSTRPGFARQAEWQYWSLVRRAI